MSQRKHAIGSIDAGGSRERSSNCASASTASDDSRSTSISGFAAVNHMAELRQALIEKLFVRHRDALQALCVDYAPRTKADFGGFILVPLCAAFLANFADRSGP